MTLHKQRVSYHRLLPILILFIGGCSGGPHLIETWRPWNANYGSPETIQPGSSFTVTIEEDNGPFNGAHTMRSTFLRSSAEDLLRRRGFTIARGDADYALTIHYKTESVERQVMTTNVKNVNVASAVSTSVDDDNGESSSSSEAVGYAALGIAIAALVATAVASGEKEPPPPSSYTNFQHTVSSSVAGKGGKSIWEGNSFWESSSTDIADEWRLALQYQLRNFPLVPGTAVEVPQLKPGKIMAYYDLHCRDKVFTSPGVPYGIEFSSSHSIVRNQEAYPAFVDLLQHADIGVPVGMQEFSDPTDPALWRHIIVGGEYLLGPNKTPVTALITLEANRHGGYYVDLAKLAGESEIAEFRQRRERWRQALTEYYNLYE